MGSSVSKPPQPMILVPQSSAPKSSFLPIAGTIVVLGLFMAILYMASKTIGSGASLSSNLVSTQVDGKTGSTVASTMSGSNTSLQFWMYIKDWDYKFGETKRVIAQTSAMTPGVSVPAVTLHPTDNALDITVSVYPGDDASLQTSNNGAGAAFTVTLENVPLQSWFSVSISIHGRNIDVYQNGSLVLSSLLPGVPMPASGNLVIGGGGGFSGSVCTVKTGSIQLQPADASGFYAAGTECSSSTPSSSSSQLNNLNLFGYNFVFGVTDSTGKQVTGLSSSDVSGMFSSTSQ
uniref:Lectin/glucanase superfamily protein n=1 Tax=viral metagenome TaxID=1070528 RepID=A0A6C0AJK1_9ZZZZ